MKLPSFPLYGDDFAQAVAGWPQDRIGVYILLLWHQWSQGGIPGDDVNALARIVRSSRVRMSRTWTGPLASKFKRHADGQWKNPRMEKVRGEVLATIKMARDRGRAGAAARWSKAKSKGGKKKQASVWKRAIRIAHDVIEAQPKHQNNWTHEVKSKMQEQHMNPKERSPRGGYVFSDAVDFALEQRHRRKA